ncbi:hypothetical protein [Streptomyces sp. NPDC059743]|uniref:hypothetical protein n=1 Tax=Streptomyces sp. NPDC059743 TaxID=3346928 RepID=UPI00366779B9
MSVLVSRIAVGSTPSVAPREPRPAESSYTALTPGTPGLRRRWRRHSLGSAHPRHVLGKETAV